MTTPSHIAAVLLAAGSSQRFGEENKLLAKIDGEPLVRHVACAVVEVGLSEIVVVTGHDSDHCRGVLSGLAVRFVHNAAWMEGMGTSIAAGIDALHTECEGAFIVPADMPNLTSALFVRLCAAFAQSDKSTIVFPVTAAGKQRNPVLWPRAYFSDLKALSGAAGAKALLLKHAAQGHGVALRFDWEARDIDTVADLAAVRSKRRSL